MFGGKNRVAVKHEGFANGFLLCDLLFSQSQSFGAITRTAVSRDRFVKCKNTRGFGSSLFSVFETTLVIARLNVVMCELLNCAANRFAISLQAFGHMTMQAAAPDRIKLFVKNFANLVMCKAE